MSVWRHSDADTVTATATPTATPLWLSPIRQTDYDYAFTPLLTLHISNVYYRCQWQCRQWHDNVNDNVNV